MTAVNAPARNYSWPPAASGNKLAVKHGAYSMALVQPRAREIGTVIFSLHDHLDPQRDADAVARLAMCLSRLEQAYWYLAEQDDPLFVDRSKGKLHPVYEGIERWEREARQADAALGLSPLARVRFGLDLLEGRRRQGEAGDAERAEQQRKMAKRLAQLPVAGETGEDGDDS